MQSENTQKLGKLKPSIKRFIFQEAIRQRNVPRELLAHRLRKEIDESRELAPSLETTKRYISKARNSDNPIDEHWTFGACRDYPTFFPPSSLLFLTKMQQETKRYVDIVTETRDPGFSIRTAIWIVRLQSLIEHYFNPDDFQQEWQILTTIAESYSAAERTSEIMGETAFDSGDLDDSVCSQNLENVLLFGYIGFKNTSRICNGDCDSCKYIPIIKGKLCQLKSIHQEQERLRNRARMIEQGLIDPQEIGDSL